MDAAVQKKQKELDLISKRLDCANSKRDVAADRASRELMEENYHRSGQEILEIKAEIQVLKEKHSKLTAKA